MQFRVGDLVKLKQRMLSPLGLLPAGWIGRINYSDFILSGTKSGLHLYEIVFPGGYTFPCHEDDMSFYFDHEDPYKHVAASMQPQNKKSFQQEMDEITAIFNDATAKAVKDVISTHSSKDSSCDHNGFWMPYHGLVESFEFCTKCDVKRPIKE